MLRTLRGKLLILMVLVALASSGTTSIVAFLGGRASLEDAAYRQLTAVREAQAGHIETYIRQIRSHLASLAEDQMVVSAMESLAAAFPSEASVPRGAGAGALDRELIQYYEREFLPRLQEKSGDGAVVGDLVPEESAARLMQYQYIVQNPYSTGSKHLYDGPDASSDGYALAHAAIHPLMRDLLVRFGYYDIFLIDSTGRIVYTVFKEVDFATSLGVGPYAATGLATAFRAARDASDATVWDISGSGAAVGSERVTHTDFSPYLPSYGAPASFMAAPIADAAGRQIGVLAFQVPVDQINNVMTFGNGWREVGLGASGETYLVSDDLTMRSDSRFLIEDPATYVQGLTQAGLAPAVIARIDRLGSTIGIQVVDTAASRAAQAGKTGAELVRDYRDVPVLSAYQPLDLPDVRWAILSEMDASEAFAPITDLARQVVLVFLLVIALVALVALGLARQLVRPINRLSTAAAAIAAGDMETAIENQARDEIGDLARSFSEMQQSIRGLIESQERQIEALATPLIPLRGDVVVLPVVGEIPVRRAQTMGEGLIEEAHARSTHVVIVDLMGARLSPSSDADQEALAVLLRAFRAAKLLGVEIIITGMRAELARLISESNLDLAGMATEPTLQMGIDRAMGGRNTDETRDGRGGR